MRLYPPGWLMTRKALSDDRLADYFVPAGTEIYIAPYLIQRHPGLWSQPHLFNPDRFLDETANGRHALAMIPFSAGPRNCIGEFLARVEMQLHLMTVVPNLRLRYASDQASRDHRRSEFVEPQRFHHGARIETPAMTEVVD